MSSPNPITDNGNSSSAGANDNGDKSSIAKKSIHDLAREAGYNDFNHFLLEYNLRMQNTTDVDEGRAILHAMFGTNEKQ